MARLLVLACLLLGITLTPSGSRALAAPAVVPADADARVEANRPNTNFGAYYRLRTDAAPTYEVYLRFNVAGYSGAEGKAVLRLYAYSPTVDGPAVYQADGSWSESEITWANRPGRSGEALDDTGAIRSRTWVELDVSSAVQGDGTYSFVLISASGDGVNFYSSEVSDPALRPRLVLGAGEEEEESGLPALVRTLVPGGWNIGGWCIHDEGCTRRQHHGVDIQAAMSSPTYAFEGGVINRVYVDTKGGNSVIFTGDSGWKYYLTHYDRLSTWLTAGQRIETGDLLGYVGMSGNAAGTVPHVHFGVFGNQHGGWIDPARVFEGWTPGSPVRSPEPGERPTGEPLPSEEASLRSESE